MSRLVFSQRAFVRSLQMSRYNIFVFVEGGLDKSFYGEAIRSAGVDDKAAIRRSSELGEKYFGKMGLLRTFRSFRRKRLLRSSFKSKLMSCLFFVDKDVDDWRGRRLRSKHLVYSSVYSVENYIFVHGDVHRGIAAALGIDSGAVAAVLGLKAKWLFDVKMAWRNWVAICLLSHERDIVGSSGYGAYSLVNEEKFGVHRSELEKNVVTRMARRSGLSYSEVKGKEREILARVERWFARGDGDRLFNGKWYAGFAFHQMRNSDVAGVVVPRGSVEDQITQCVLSTLDFGGGWVEFVRGPLLREKLWVEQE